ncbi:nitrate reductase [Colwellia sp. UCD-KL20]|uniref:nitrate reductase n=1 Tax=Colwellia sp. UCD-KL20 TaxID=1917165 RepID=UPI000970D824|nr:nitrate reductase [Colwellia sp. UCD-KL20]
MNSNIIFTDKQNATVSLASSIYKTTCPYCGVGCGVSTTVVDNKIVAVKGDENHPSNFGRLCVKGSSLHETVADTGRILTPKVFGKQASWEEATSTVAEHFKQTIAEHGPDSVAFYVSGQILTEDYYVVNKLMKGFIGSANVDTNSRLCMASASVAHKRAFGEDAVPGCYEDLEQAEVIFIVGSNPAYAHPIVYQRIVKAKENNPQLKVVVIDPRATATSKNADLHIKLKPGSDAFYFNGLLAYLAENNAIDTDYIEQHCLGYSEALDTVKSQMPTLENVAKACDIKLKTLLESYQLFAQHKKVVSMFSMGINQSSSGVDKGNAIINCHLASGKIGYVGAGPFSITGQPNAMGGREVGGLANQLAGHMHFENPNEIDLVQRFWNAPKMAQKQGLKAVDMFDAVNSGKIKAIWIIATNPVVSMPNANLVKKALQKCPMVVVSESYESAETVNYADVVLPATTWGEKEGMVTSSERTISLQKSLVRAPGMAKNDWEIVTLVAQKMEFSDAFTYKHAHDIFKEHAALSGFENISADENMHRSGTEGSVHRAFDISGLANLSLDEYLNFTPTPWPINAENPKGTKRLFTQGGFATKTGKANFVPVVAKYPQVVPSAKQVIMNTGRIRDQWHTMTRTGRVPKLMTHLSEPFIQINAKDAKRLNVVDKALLQLDNLGSTYIGRAQITDEQRVGEIFVPIHWNDSFSKSAKVSALISSITDALSGQPEFKQCPVNISAFNAKWSGYLVSTMPVKLTTDYWTMATIEQGVKYVIADKQGLPYCADDSETFLQTHFPEISDWLVLKDDKSHILRIAGFVNNVLTCFFAGGTDLSVKYSTQFIEKQIGKKHNPKTRFKLLSALDSDGSLDVGEIICSCFQVGEKTIKQAIASGDCSSVEALGKQLKCGTNCGSCIPELKAFISS